MENDRLLNILRWVVTPIALAAITGYFQMRVSANTAQTKATYDTLAPNVLQLQTQVATLTGRIEEVSRRPVFIPCPEAPKTAGKSSHAEAPKPHTLEELLGGKMELMMDSASKAPATEAPSPKKVPARFEDMLQQQEKY